MGKRIVTTRDCWVINLPQVLMTRGACKSKSEAKRLIKQGAVEINGAKVYEPNICVDDGATLHCGKHFWGKLAMPPLTLEVYD